MKYSDAKIIVFAKAPISGQCKTRLIPALGREGAAQLHGQLVHHTLVTATASSLAPVELWCADNVDHPFITTCAEHFNVQIKQQYGEDLGKRMENCFRDTLVSAKCAVIIGTDCPSLSVDDLNQAFEHLHNNTQCTLHPASDGGYVAIGLSEVDEVLFHNIHWGTSSVYTDTQARLAQLGWRWKALATHHDIDRPEDLAVLEQLILAK